MSGKDDKMCCQDDSGWASVPDDHADGAKTRQSEAGAGRSRNSTERR